MTTRDVPRPPMSSLSPLPAAIAGCLRGSTATRACALGFVAAAVVSAADAAVLTVGNTNASGAGSLRQAILSANAIPGEDTIQFAWDVAGTIDVGDGPLRVTDRLTIRGPGKDVLTLDGRGRSTVLEVAAPLMVSGLTLANGAPNGFRYRGAWNDVVTLGDIAIVGAAGDGIAIGSGNVPSPESLSLRLVRTEISGNGGSGVAVSWPVDAGEYTSFFGGVEDVTIAANGDAGIKVDPTTERGRGAVVRGSGARVAGNAGGGIAGTEDLWLTNSEIADNGGDGIRTGSIHLFESTVSGNQGAGVRGGIPEQSIGPAYLGVLNATISGNGGPGLHLNGYCMPSRCSTIRITHSTIVGSGAAGPAPGMHLNLYSMPQDEPFEPDWCLDPSTFGPCTYDPAPMINNVVISGSSGAEDLLLTGNLGLGGDVHLDHSMIGDPGGAVFSELVPGSNLFGLDPRLGPLADNGGPTRTHALPADSPLIDTGGDPAYPLSPILSPIPDFDQRGRGYARVQNGRLDIGAYEVQVDPPSGPKPLLRAVGDVNGNGSADFAMIARAGNGPVRVIVLDGGTGTRVGRFALSEVTTPVAAVVLPRFGGSDDAALAVLGARGLTEIRHVRSGVLLDTIAFNLARRPMDLGALDVRGIPALAVLSGAAGGIFVRSIETGGLLRQVTYYRDLRPKGLVVSRDRDGNAMLGMLGENLYTDRGDKVQLRDPANGALLGNLWLGTEHTVRQSIVIGDVDGNGVDDVATLRTKPGSVSVVLRDPVTGRRIRGIAFGPWFAPVAMSGVGDANGNGSPDIAVLAREPQSGAQSVEIKDGRTGAPVCRMWLPEEFVAVALDRLEDLDGNGADEVVVVGRRESDGKLTVFIRDAATARQLKRIWF